MVPFLLTLACTTPTPTPVQPPPPREAAPSPIPTAPPAPAITLSFDTLPPVADPARWDRVHTTATYRAGGEARPLAWTVLTEAGKAYGDHVLGQIPTPAGPPFQVDGKPFLCDDLDGTGLLQAHGGLFLVQHAECIPGGVYLTSLDRGADGTLTATTTRPVDHRAIRATFNPCAGSVTPWGSWLSSQEYEPDRRLIGPDGKLPEDRYGYHRLADLLGVPSPAVDPYDYGWIPEYTVTDTTGAVKVRRHYSLGRFSHEVARVMPDGKTVLLSDDGPGTGMFMFVAEKPGDLAGGRLYAAKWTGTPDGGAALDWVDLGAAHNAEIAPAVEQLDHRFEDLFRYEAPKDGACATDLTSVWVGGRQECLTVLPGMDQLAGRLESRRVAALRGATLELHKGEGIAVDEARKVAYWAFSSIDGGMLRGAPSADVDQVQLDANPCGAVFALKLGPGASDQVGRRIDSEWVPQSADIAVAGTPEGDDRCALDGIANPDNLAFVPEAGLVLIAEDTRAHDLAALWGYSVVDGTLTRLLLTPFRGEVTGIGWYPDVGGAGYLTVTVQHPFEPSKMPKTPPPGLNVPATPPPSVTGVLGPIRLGAAGTGG